MSIRTVLAIKLVKRLFKKRFFLAKLTKFPVFGRMIEFAFFEDDDIIILPMESALAKNREPSRKISLNIAVELESIVLPSKIIEHFIEKSRYHFIMNHCICRESNSCKDYPHELGCIFLGRGVLKIDSRLGRLATKEEALEHLRKCREAGLVHLIGRNKIDAMVFSNSPKEDLLSICSCCPCCCLWKMIPYLSNKIGSTVTRMPGIRVEVEQNLCTGCGRCVSKQICFVNAIKIQGERASINQNLCKGCARCVEFCTNRAMKLVIEDENFMKSSIERIAPLVDINAE